VSNVWRGGEVETEPLGLVVDVVHHASSPSRYADLARSQPGRPGRGRRLHAPPARNGGPGRGRGSGSSAHDAMVLLGATPDTTSLASDGVRQALDGSGRIWVVHLQPAALPAVHRTRGVGRTPDSPFDIGSTARRPLPGCQVGRLDGIPRRCPTGATSGRVARGRGVPVPCVPVGPAACR
jgi:hypothetical protein